MGLNAPRQNLRTVNSGRSVPIVVIESDTPSMMNDPDR
jgi:hypothetical protein